LGTFINPQTGEFEEREFLYPIHFETNEPSTFVDVPLLSYYGSNAIIFDDAVFNGKKHLLKIYSEDIRVAKSDLSKKDVPVYIYFRSINKELYNYYLSMKKYNEVQDNPFSEPVNVYSNIKNGYGIFGGSAMTLDSVVLKLDEVFGNKKVKY